MDNEEKRQLVRCSLETVVSLHGKSRMGVGFSENISSKGMFINTNEPFEPGKKLGMRFILPSEIKMIKTAGVVCWNRHGNDSFESGLPGMGIRFVDLQPGDHQMLAKYLRSKNLSTFET